MKKWRAFIERSKHFLFVSLLIVITFCYAMFQGGFVSWFVFFTVSPFLLYAFIVPLVREDIYRVEREIEPSRIESGQSVHVTMHVERKTRFPFVYILAEELVASEMLIQSKIQQKDAIKFVGFKKVFTWNYTLDRLPRGEHRYLGVNIIFHDFFGWAQKRIAVEKEQIVLVYPKVHDMKYTTLQAKLDIGSMMAPYSMVKDTSMAVGLREYIPGDRFSWIHWKSFAKTHTLLSKEFEDRQSQELLLMLDEGASPLFEEKIELVASMLKTIVQGHGDISFVSLGAKQTKRFSAIQDGKQLDRVMRHLASVIPVENATYPLREHHVLQRVATLLYVTSEVSDELLHMLDNSVKSCICFIVAPQTQALANVTKRYKHVQVVYVDATDNDHLFMEVMKL